ncbi:uncharacterized protein LOC130047675 [Ostrea edulis]|uniref:uncharacterized protein LOC130047675 n=1 Tax=Ostrea edulis TaxID=37623 RepID=UPI0024AF1076|nr:uncharacterized protein LOC130047675 [Ostrea edulis]XP_055999025.1 uncharacterized protein LOC130047675 [Ostrea edulis]XP_055999026.1 uncharacterized protein LOC130047675 [Ostrea edulis]XP_055999027.1 uncharacterized protein LOC130047675 [Ostrea edulis]
MTRKNAAAYFNGEIANEVRERGLFDIYITKNKTREDLMKQIHSIRKEELYEHREEDCSPLCKSKGCSNLRVIDSCWKVCMCHCMFAVPMEVGGYPLLTFPNVCTLEPKHGSVFCKEHFNLLERHNIPTKKDFLKFLGCAGFSMDNIKILDGQWHVRNGKRWNIRSNFVFDILYEVAHPQDSIYVVEVTTDSGQKGEAFFKAGDLHNPKDFQTSLNRTFKVGTLLCHFKQVELLQLVAQMASEARRRAEAVTYRRRMVLNAGKQEGTSIIFLSPNQIMDISTGAMIHPMDCPFMWLKGEIVNLRGPKMDIVHEIRTPIGLTTLTAFLGKAEVILKENIGPAILAWSSMYSLNLYQKWMDTIRHFNLPMLYGPPTAGKTLIAHCAAWMNGCSELHIASRCTLAFVTSWLTTSSLPFVWDDPTSSEEVAQLAIDLGNGAVRGRVNEDTKKPLTGCLVTANFDLSAAYKYFSRLFVLKIYPLKDKKRLVMPEYWKRLLRHHPQHFH